MIYTRFAVAALLKAETAGKNQSQPLRPVTRRGYLPGLRLRCSEFVPQYEPLVLNHSVLRLKPANTGPLSDNEDFRAHPSLRGEASLWSVGARESLHRHPSIGCETLPRADRSYWDHDLRNAVAKRLENRLQSAAADCKSRPAHQLDLGSVVDDNRISGQRTKVRLLSTHRQAR
jgi:hypothetical protein